MESANLYEHHHQLQLQHQPQALLYSSSSSNSHGVSSALHDFNPGTNIILDGYELNRYMNEILPNSPSGKSTPWLQEIRFGGDVQPPANNNKLQFENIMRGNISDTTSNFLKLSGDNMNCSFINNSYSYIIKNHEQQEHHEAPAAAAALIDLNQNLGGCWLSATTQSYSSNGESFAKFGSNLMSSCTDNNNNYLYACSPSLQLAAEHDVMSYRNGAMEASINQSFAERSCLSYFDVQQSTHSPSNSSNIISESRNEASRAEKLHASNTNQVAVAKKPRLSSSSCPTLKVRKEKLGDRIAALHRLVSPFGKTDTASVLTEAIGYIQFLQNQIQTLSMSYLKSSRNKSSRSTPRDLTMKEVQNQKEAHEGKIRDLKSRGLCLVPLAFTSYICSFNGTI